MTTRGTSRDLEALRKNLLRKLVRINETDFIAKWDRIGHVQLG